MHVLARKSVISTEPERRSVNRRKQEGGLSLDLFFFDLCPLQNWLPHLARFSEGFLNRALPRLRLPGQRTSERTRPNISSWVIPSDCVRNMGLRIETDRSLVF